MRFHSAIRLFFAAALLFSGFVAGAAARGTHPSTATQRLAEQNDADGPLAQSVWGFSAVNLKGDTLVWLNPERRLVPASNLKLVTTGAALLSFGGDYRFSTSFATDGAVQDSILCGNLYILGGGDPLIGELFPYLPKQEEVFGSWDEVLRSNGIKGIAGDIVGEGSYFSAPRYHTDWSSEDLETRDGVVPAGLTWRGRMGDSIPDGPYPAALHYLQWLRRDSSYLAGAAREWNPEDPSPDSLALLGSVASASLRELVRVANCQSDNFIAETLLKALGKKISGDDGYSSSTEALRRALSPVGHMGSSGAMRFADGSGLSRKNYITPAFMTSYLKAMTRSRVWNDFLASLPYAGERKTTLENRLPKRPYALKHRIRMKSGSMNGVRCFSGYILPPDGRKENIIVFSILTNNAVAQGSQVYPLIDAMIESLAHENE